MIKTFSIHSDDLVYSIGANYSESDGMCNPVLTKKDAAMNVEYYCGDSRILYHHILKYLKTYVRTSITPLWIFPDDVKELREMFEYADSIGFFDQCRKGNENNRHILMKQN